MIIMVSITASHTVRYFDHVVPRDGLTEKYVPVKMTMTTCQISMANILKLIIELKKAKGLFETYLQKM